MDISLFFKRLKRIFLIKTLLFLTVVSFLLSFYYLIKIDFFHKLKDDTEITQKKNEFIRKKERLDKLKKEYLTLKQEYEKYNKYTLSPSSVYKVFDGFLKYLKNLKLIKDYRITDIKYSKEYINVLTVTVSLQSETEVKIVKYAVKSVLYKILNVKSVKTANKKLIIEIYQKI